jgi:ATP-binding cassette subfamily B protein
LSTILAAHEILVIKDGMILERGNHVDLIKLGGTYAELCETQFYKSES